MTLTIDEGQKICEDIRKTGRSVQMGTQQHSELGCLKEFVLIQAGQMGELKKATSVSNDGSSKQLIPKGHCQLCISQGSNR